MKHGNNPNQKGVGILLMGKEKSEDNEEGYEEEMMGATEEVIKSLKKGDTEGVYHSLSALHDMWHSHEDNED